MPSIDCDTEFAEAAAAMTVRDFDALCAQGVNRGFLLSGSSRVGIAEARTLGDRRYEPRPGGDRQFVVPIYPLPSLWADDCWLRGIPDLVAWQPNRPEAWWRRLGACPLLNPRAVDAALEADKPLKLWRTPLAYLRAAGEGAVVLEFADELRPDLAAVREIECETVALAERVERFLGPRIMVPSGVMA